MCHRVCHKSDIAFSCCLLHNRSFTDSGRSYQKNRALSYRRYQVLSLFVLLQIRFYSVNNLFLSSLYVHNCSNLNIKSLLQFNLYCPRRNCRSRIILSREYECRLVCRACLRIYSVPIGKIQHSLKIINLL